MKRRLAIIMAALLIAAMAGCQQSGTSSTVDSSTVQSSVTESAESEISEAESSVVSEETSTESSGEKSEASKTESSDKSSKTESSQSKTEESSKKETSKAESSKTETSKTESSKSESSKAEEPKVTGINIDMSSLSLTSGTSYELNAYILWSNNTQSYQGITWSSNNSSVASVNSTGYVTAKSAGTATITASYGSFKKSCTVTVKAAQVSQPSQPSGGSSGGNWGSTSKPSGGGTSHIPDDDSTRGSSTPSKPSQTVNDGSPVLTDAWFKANCRAIKTSDGTIVYEFPQLMDYINEYRRDMGVAGLTWNNSEAVSYKEALENLKELKNSREYKLYGLEYLRENYPGCFDSEGNIILTEEYYNKHYANQSNGIAEEAVYCSIHGCNHDLHYASANVTEDIGYTMKQFIEDIRVNSPGHFNTWVRKENRNFYACVAIRGDRFFVSSQ